MTQRILRIAAVSAIALGAVFCAPPKEGAPQLSLMMSRAFVSNTKEIQITVLKPAEPFVNAPNVDKRCGKDVAAEVGSTYLLLQLDGQNKPRARSVAFGADDNDVVLEGIEPGSDYVFVAEALSLKEPPTLLASGRSRVQKFEAKENTLINLTLVGSPDGGDLAACDPTVAPTP